MPIIANGQVVGVQITRPGSGYTSAPTVTFSISPLGVPETATATAVLSGSQVASVTMTFGGSGYLAGAELELQLQTDDLRGDAGITAADNMIPKPAKDSITLVANAMDFTVPLNLAGTGIGYAGALNSISGINVWNAPVTIGGAAIGVEPDPNQAPTAGYLATDYSLTVEGGGSSSIGSASKVGNTVTITVAGTLPSSFTQGASVTINGLGVGYNGTFAISSAGANSFTYTSGTVNLATITNEGVASRDISGGSLTKVGGGDLILPTANTYTSFTDVYAGWITVENNQSLGLQNPSLPQTQQPYTTVENGAAVMLKPVAAAGATALPFLTLPNNFNITGLGITDHDILINQGGAIENLDGTNVLTGIIQLQDENNVGAGIGVEQVFPLGGIDTIPSQLTLTGPLWNSQEVTAPASTIFADAQPNLYPNVTGGGIVKLGSQRLIIQGPGTYLGNDAIDAGAILLQNDTGLGAGAYVNSEGTTVDPTTTVDLGASLELGNSVNSQNGGLAGGLAVYGEGLVINGIGDESVAVVAITNAGSGYQSVPTVNFSGGGGTGAAGIAIVKNGEVVGVEMTNVGSGYTSAPTVTLTGGNPTGTAATAVASLPLGDLGPITVLTSAGMTTGPFNDPIFATDNLWAGPITLASPSNFDVQANGRLVVTGSIGDATNPITAAAESGTTVTITAANPFLADFQANPQAAPLVSVTGLSPAGYNGTFIVTSATATQFTYTDLAGLGAATVSSNAAAAASGTLNMVDTGEVDLYGINSYSGTTYVDQGVLSIGANQALGATGTASVQVLTLTNPVSDATQFNLQFGSLPTNVTPTITYTGFTSIDTQAIANALDNLPTVNGAPDLGGNATVTEPSPGVFTVTFGGSLLGFPQPQMVASLVSGSGTGNVATTVINPGGGGTVINSDASLQIAGSDDIPGEPLLVTGNGDTSAPNVPTQWFPVGPAPITSGQTNNSDPVTGRVTGVVSDPNDPNIIYIATAGGGAWKTIDGGQSWHQIFDSIPDVQTIDVAQDGTTFTLGFTGPDSTGTSVTDTTIPITYSAADPDQTAAAIQAALNDPNTMTNIGGVDGLVTVTQAADAAGGTLFTVTFQGTLAGQNITQLQQTVTGGSGTVTVATVETGTAPQFALYCGAIAMDPTDSNIIYLGTGKANNSADSFYGTGLYRSTDGGITWSLMVGASETSPGTDINPFLGKGINAITIDVGSSANPLLRTIYVADGDATPGQDEIQNLPGGGYTISFIGANINGTTVIDVTPAEG